MEMTGQFARTELLLGEAAMERLREKLRADKQREGK